MDSVTKWSYRLGLSSGLCALIGAFCLAILDAISPAGTSGNREAPEAVVGILTFAFILLGFVVFFGAVRKLRQMGNELTPRMKVLLMCALVATNFVGGYAFFFGYSRLHSHLG